MSGAHRAAGRRSAAGRGGPGAREEAVHLLHHLLQPANGPCVLLGGRESEQMLLDDLSIGSSDDLKRATMIARALVEEFVPGRELTVAVMGDKPLGVTEILADAGTFYDYESKYAAGGSRHVSMTADTPARCARSSSQRATLKRNRVPWPASSGRPATTPSESEGPPARVVTK